MPVTQADRDAAASFLNSIEPVQWAGTHDPYTIPDDSRAVQAFMRHREAALDEAAECQPSTAENPNESAYQRGRFDAVLDFQQAILRLKDKSDD